MDSLRKINLPTWSVALALLALSVLGYGLLAPWQGFYWDDWPSIWYLHNWGPGIFKEAFAMDRPLLGRLFMLTTPLVGQSPLAWQLFGLLTRWLSSLAFWLTLRLIWPKFPRQTAWAALLFAVYPGFSQQFISVTYSHVFILLCVFLLSYAAMVAAVRLRRWFWPLYLLSIVLSVLSMFSVEYFFGLELLRPLVLWLVLSDSLSNRKQRLLRTLALWAPYLLVMGGFLVWRVAFSTTPRGQVTLLEHIQARPLQTLLDLARTIPQDLFQAGLLAWVKALDWRRLADFGRLATLLYILVTALAGGLAALYLLAFRPAESSEPATRRSWGRQAAGLGLVALLLGGWPFWATSLRIELIFPWDRFTLALLPGASLLLVGLLEWLLRPIWPRMLILALAIGLAVGLQFQYANAFRREWTLQRAFFWQLAWRAPGIQPGTLLLSSELPFPYSTDNSLTAPLNWMYSPGSTSRTMDYLLYDIDTRLQASLPALEGGQRIERDYRSSSFHGSTDQALVLYYLPPGCLKLLDPRRDAQIPQKPKYLSDAMPLSRPELVLPDPAAPALPAQPYFGSEPPHDWCYYFEKADLALQTGDWAQVSRLGDQALSLDMNLYEVNAPELLPYIEGYAHTGNWNSAEELTMKAIGLSSRMTRILCSTWERIHADTLPENPSDASPSQPAQAAYEHITGKLNCPAP